MLINFSCFRNLADVSNDNLLNVDEFVLCMHLIQEVLKGRKTPGDLPENLKPKMSAPVDLPAITSIEREAYVKVFQTVDDKRKGYLEGKKHISKKIRFDC